MLDDDGDERRELEKSIAQVQHDQHRVQQVTWMAALFFVLAITCIGYEAVLQESFPYTGSKIVFKLLCELALASLISLGAFAVLLTVYRRKLNRLKEECRQLVVQLLGSHPGKPHMPTLPGSHRGAGNREGFEAAAGSGVLMTDSLASSMLRIRPKRPIAGDSL
jgi:hypothetical protein